MFHKEIVRFKWIIYISLIGFIALIIKKLYETTFFTNISVEIKNGVMNISVKENPIIHTIILKGEKAKKFTEQINELLLVRERTSFVTNNIKHDVNQIKSFYRNIDIMIW